ncbi:MAG TPA: transglutaminase family protein [Chthoniobacterales bacterium]|nr:transglutaminase family protein [Chthoniobacterales bacterium]
MKFTIQCHLGYQVSTPASFLFNVAIAQNSFQRLTTERFEVAGARSCREMVVGGQRYHRATAQSGSVELLYEASVEATHELLGDPGQLQVPLFEQIPADALVFLYPSRFCQSDLLARLAKREFNQNESGFYRVTRICNWIYERIEYLSGTTTPTTSAFDTVTELVGVCRDFAHLAIAFCRSLGIPARFVSAFAYGLNPPDFHAYVEAFLGGRWILFDPTRLAPQSSFVRIGHGRDAADTSFATIFGGAVMNKMELSMNPAHGQSGPPQYTTDPISNYPP